MLQSLEYGHENLGFPAHQTQCSIQLRIPRCILSTGVCTEALEAEYGGRMENHLLVLVAHIRRQRFLDHSKLRACTPTVLIYFRMHFHGRDIIKACHHEM